MVNTKIDTLILPALNEVPDFVKRLKTIYETGIICWDHPKEAGIPCTKRLEEIFEYYDVQISVKDGCRIHGLLKEWNHFFPIVQLVRFLKKNNILDSGIEYDEYDPDTRMEFERRYAHGNSKVWARWINEPWIRYHPKAEYGQ